MSAAERSAVPYASERGDFLATCTFYWIFLLFWITTTPFANLSLTGAPSTGDTSNAMNQVTFVATALLAVLVAFSPVLSPQFLFWLLPVSAAAYGFGLPNVLLVAACVLTQLMLQFYSRMVVDFDPEFVWRLAGRNAMLLAYTVVVCAPIVAAALRAGGGEAETASAGSGPAPAT